MRVTDVIVYVGTSFIGSFMAVALFLHWDLEDRWRLWKAKQGRKREERERTRADRDLAHHMELLDEERRREHGREYGPHS